MTHNSNYFVGETKALKSIHANGCLSVVIDRNTKNKKKNMWLGLFYFSVGNLLIKKKQSKEDIWPTTPQKV